MFGELHGVQVAVQGENDNGFARHVSNSIVHGIVGEKRGIGTCGGGVWWV